MQIGIVTPAAAPSHPQHWQVVLAAILAAEQQVAPTLYTILPPQAAAGLAIGTALEPVVIGAIEALEADRRAKSAQSTLVLVPGTAPAPVTAPSSPLGTAVGPVGVGPGTASPFASLLPGVTT